MVCDARELFLRQRRFDLIFKYLYVVKPNDDFVRLAYLESIRAFNGYFEVSPSDGVPKDTPAKFISSFDTLIKSVRAGGFRISQGGGGGIPIGVNGEIMDGAHRLSTAAALGLPVEISEREGATLCDYKFFKRHNMSSVIMDYGALEYVRLNPCAAIVSMSVFAKPALKKTVESVLNKEGFVYYQKRVWFRRVSVFVCESKEKLEAVRRAIQESVGIENRRVRISETHEETIVWAEHYFGKSIALKRLRYILKYRLYRKERRDNGERALYLFGVRVFGYRVSKRYHGC